MNKYFTYEDKKIEKLNDFEIPKEWWSRFYEYAFALDFLKEGETILDVGCGIEHPFKFYAMNKVKKVVAIDKDSRINSLKREYRDSNLEFVNADILNYKSEVKFDKIFCISVLEHTQSFLIEKMKNIKNLLSDKGRIIITCDSPILRAEKLIDIAKSINLKLVGKNEYESVENAIKSERYNLNCYSMILRK